MRRPKSGERPARRWWIAVLLLVIGFAAYRIGLQVWGGYQFAKVEQAIEQRDFGQARAALDRCLWLWPDKPELHLVAARTARRAGSTADVRPHLLRCWNDPAMREAASLESRLIQIESADLSDIDDLGRFCREHPNADEAALIAEALIKGSLAALEVERAGSWLDWWSEHRRGTPDRVQGLLWRAAAHEQARESEQARQACREAVKLDPDHREARLTLARLLLQNDPEEAASHLDQLLAHDPADPALLFEQARALRALGRLEQAGQTLDQVLQIKPRWIEALVERGLVELDLRRTDAAERWLRRAEELSPKHRAVLLAMVEYLRQSGQTDEMERYQEQIKTIEADLRERLEMALDAQTRHNRSPPAASLPD